MDACEFLFPSELQVTATGIARIILIGSCLSEFYKSRWQTKHDGLEVEFCLFNNAQDLPERGTEELCQFDFAYVQLPLRSLLTDTIVNAETLVDSAKIDQVRNHAFNTLDAMLDCALQYNRQAGLLTLVANFIVPQVPVSTSLSNRGGDGDLAELVRRLNRRLHDRIGKESGVYLADVDALASSMGKRYFLDDSIVFYSHGSVFFSDWVEMEAHPSWTAPLPGRIEPVPTLSDIYENRSEDFFFAVFRQAEAIYRSVNQIDSIKAVIFDLDNTLWRGQIAEHYHEHSKPYYDGWPIGIWEAVQHLKARGILVAVASKNDEDVVRRNWSMAVGEGWISPEDFFPFLVSWAPKAKAVQEILTSLSLTDHSVLFVDDNPVERESVKAAHPNIRTIGSNPFTTRRILLWAAETQIATLTTESRRRGEMIREQHARENERKVLSRPDFLLQLGAEISVRNIREVGDPDYPRAFELLNKTNQFNTNGRRWVSHEMAGFFSAGGLLLAIRVKDKFTSYGLVGLLLLKDAAIEQMVMSCRVLGMDIELAAISSAVRQLRLSQPNAEIEANILETEANVVCRDVFVRAGFRNDSLNQGCRLFILPKEDEPVSTDHLAVAID